MNLGESLIPRFNTHKMLQMIYIRQFDITVHNAHLEKTGGFFFEENDFVELPPLLERRHIWS